MAFLYDWRAAVMSAHGPEAATTRHVLLTLAAHMDQDGGSCFPSIRTLMAETALSNRSIITHLDRAEAAGWIERSTAGHGGQGWKRHEYTARLPKVVKDVHHVNPEGGEGGSPRRAEGGEPRSKKVVKEVHSSSSKEESNNRRACERFMAATDSEWRLKTPMAEWTASLPADYPGIPIAHEVLKAAEWYEERGRTLKAPHRAIRNWLEKAKPATNGTNPMGMTAADLREWEADL